MKICWLLLSRLSSSFFSLLFGFWFLYLLVVFLFFLSSLSAAVGDVLLLRLSALVSALSLSFSAERSLSCSSSSFLPSERRLIFQSGDLNRRCYSAARCSFLQLSSSFFSASLVFFFFAFSSLLRAVLAALLPSVFFSGSSSSPVPANLHRLIRGAKPISTLPRVSLSQMPLLGKLSQSYRVAGYGSRPGPGPPACVVGEECRSV